MQSASYIQNHKVGKREKTLNKRQLDLLKHTPFYEFFNVFYEDKILLKESKKHQENLDEIYSCYSPQEDMFVFGEEQMKITEKDVSLLFYMPVEGSNIVKTTKMTNRTIPSECKDFILRNFKSEPIINRNLIEARIKEETVKKKKDFEEDLPLLLIMDILVTFFFPNNQQKLRWGFVPFILDIDKMNSVSWPKTIQSNFSKNVKKFMHNPRNMSGCSMLPLVRFFFSK